MSFVLGATRHGPMIFSQFDFAVTPDGSMYGVGAQLTHFSQYDPREVQQLKELLDLRRKHFGDGVVMLDGGANIGVMTVECARHMEGWGTVLAFEAQERIFQALCGNLALNNLRNGRALNVALGKGVGFIGVPSVDYEQPGSFGSLELDGPNDDLGQDLAGRLLDMVTLRSIDSYAYLRLDLLKLDVEGMEVDVLTGAAGTIARCKPILFVEHIKTGVEAVEAVLKPLGYTCLPAGMNLVCVPGDAEYIRQIPETPIEKAVRLGEAGDAAAALEIMDEIIRQSPDNHTARYNRGVLLMQLGRFQDAIAEYDTVVEAAERGATTTSDVEGSCRFGRGFANLVLGNLQVGFAGFEFRRKPEVPPSLAAIRKLEPADLWENEPLVKGSTVLVLGEMGFGDNIWGSRYFDGLVAAGANVIASVPPQLGRLFHCLHGIQVHSEHSPVPDMWCHMMSLPYLFRTDIDTVPVPADFHLPEPQVARWKGATMLSSSAGRLKVGLCWSGSRKSQYDSHRSIPLAALAPIFDVPGVDFYSLQLDVRETDKTAYDDLTNMFGMADRFNDFLDTACAMWAMDLIITVDTSVAHLAGTLGLPTWVLLTAFRTYWLWIEGREDSPWYPSARAYRQETMGDWGPVVERVTEDLRTFMLASSDARNSPAVNGKGNRILS